MPVLLFLGFSSGLPLVLTAGTLQAWMTVSGIDIRTICSCGSALYREIPLVSSHG